jgi:hypothetical protein
MVRSLTSLVSSIPSSNCSKTSAVASIG